MATSRRLELAKTLAGQLRTREGRNLVAVGVYGSVARGEDRAHSDVDVLVVLRRKRAAIRHFVRDGILITILQQTPQEARAEVTGSRGDLNAVLGGWRSLRPLYDPSGLLRKLIKRARDPTEAQFREAARRALIETYEDLGKVRNAVDVGDEQESREMAVWYAGAAAGALLDLHRHASSGPAGVRSSRFAAMARWARRSDGSGTRPCRWSRPAGSRKPRGRASSPSPSGRAFPSRSSRGLAEVFRLENPLTPRREGPTSAS